MYSTIALSKSIDLWQMKSRRFTYLVIALFCFVATTFHTSYTQSLSSIVVSILTYAALLWLLSKGQISTFHHHLLCLRLRNVKNKLVNASEAIGLSKQTPMAFILQEIGIEAEVKINWMCGIVFELSVINPKIYNSAFASLYYFGIVLFLDPRSWKISSEWEAKR